MNIKIHDDQNIKIYRQDQYCWNFWLPQVLAWFHTALLWGESAPELPFRCFPHNLGPKALGEGFMCLFYLEGFSFASKDFISPLAHRPSCFSIPVVSKGRLSYRCCLSRTGTWGPTHTQPFSFRQGRTCQEARLFLYCCTSRIFLFHSDGFSPISSFFFHTVGPLPALSPSWKKSLFFCPQVT